VGGKKRRKIVRFSDLVPILSPPGGVLCRVFGKTIPNFEIRVGFQSTFVPKVVQGCTKVD
jgi:hypothetical protein